MPHGSDSWAVGLINCICFVATGVRMTKYDESRGFGIGPEYLLSIGEKPLAHRMKIVRIDMGGRCHAG